MGLAEGPKAVGQSDGGHGGCPHGLCSLTCCTAGNQREQNNPNAGAFDAFNHSKNV
jgi:hypothetical protein